MTDEELRLILRLRDDVLQARERLLDDALRAREAIRPSIEAAFDAFSQGRSFASMLAGQEAATAPPRWEPEIYLPSHRREAVLPSEPEPPEPIRRRIGFAAW